VRKFLEAGFHVIGFDVDKYKVKQINSGNSYIKHISSNFIKEYVKNNKLKATCDYSEIKKCDALLICVPTPIGKHYEPNLQYVINSLKEVAKHLKKGHIIILESTTYPGTTKEIF